MKRLTQLLATTTLACLCGACEDVEDADLVALDAVALQAELAAGRVSALQVTEAFLARIAALDDTGPTLGAVLEMNPDATAIARALDEHRARGAALGPLHGIPVLLKANIDTADAMATSAGSLALAEHHASRDAEIVTRLREAGAVLLGKTNLSEWANFRSMQSTSGWSSAGGQTRNPYVLDRNPCGSSSGAAVAIAARFAPLAVGTETDGSIVCPAGVNGVVGLKPTYGLVSARGVVPLAASQDTVGPLARTVADAALLLGVLAAAPPTEVPNAASVAGLRIGVLRDQHGTPHDPFVAAAFDRALRLLRDAGATLLDPVVVNLPPEIARAELRVLLAEFDDGIADYLAGVMDGPHSLAELIQFNDAHRTEVMPHFGQDLLLAAQASGGLDSAHYRAATASREEARAVLARAFAERELDALLAPTNARAWPIDYSAGDAVVVSSSRLAAVTGYPSISVPMELASDLPLGLSFIGQPRQERALLELAAAFERLRGPFPEPAFLPAARD